MVSESRPQEGSAVNMPSDGDAVSASSRSNNSSEEKVKVVVRVRPLQAREEPWSKAAEADVRGPDVNSTATITVQENEVIWEKNGQLKILKADAVFANGASQDSVYRSVSAMSGLQRDESGIVDVVGPVPMNHGVVPRSIERLFAEIERENRGSVGASFSVYCSFIEIYNEKIFDILSPEVLPVNGNQSPDAKAGATKGAITQRARWNSSISAKDAKSLQIRQKLDGSVFVDGMTSRNVTNKAELLQAFREGSQHREVRDNLYNQFSSRGHAVFQITLRRTLADDGSSKINAKKTRLSKLFFVDLAGSEKWHVNGSDLTDKYASELASINKSLSALTNCVMALTQKERSHVPFRDSVLTRLLQPCLQGSGRTAFIATISPSKGCLEESFATLRFAERLKAIRCRPVRRSLFSNEMLGEQRLYYERQIQAMRVSGEGICLIGSFTLCDKYVSVAQIEVNRLRELLRKANQKPNEAAGSSSNAALVEENRRLRELLVQAERSRVVDRNERSNNKNGKPTATGGSTVRMPPQQFSARQMLKPTSNKGEEELNIVRQLRQDRQRNNTTDQLVEDASGSPGKASAQPRDQLTTLETQLQSKEARLNWMLEAEMEAQNAGNTTSGATPGDPRTAANSYQIVGCRDEAASTTCSDPTTYARYAAGSTRRREVKQPRGDTKLAIHQRKAESGQRVLPVLVSSPPASSRTDLASDQPTSRRVPRQPVRHCTPSPPTESHSPADQTTAASRRSRVSTIAKSHSTGRSELTTSTEQMKASSILKMVGSGSGDPKTRAEIIEEYKRARRVELEAMMRTMVQK
ncbi:Kinesin-like protein [Phytophthora cactorum]|nr:Kinesin-like protein [Phytophthora cactorum]